MEKTTQQIPMEYVRYFERLPFRNPEENDKEMESLLLFSYSTDQHLKNAIVDSFEVKAQQARRDTDMVHHLMLGYFKRPQTAGETQP